MVLLMPCMKLKKKIPQQPKTPPLTPELCRLQKKKRVFGGQIDPKEKTRRKAVSNEKKDIRG